VFVPRIVALQWLCDFGGPTERVHLIGVSISFEKNFYRLPFTPPLSGRLIGPSDDPYTHTTILTDALFILGHGVERVSIDIHSFVSCNSEQWPRF
jgi:hypothetical protein